MIRVPCHNFFFAYILLLAIIHSPLHSLSQTATWRTDSTYNYEFQSTFDSLILGKMVCEFSSYPQNTTDCYNFSSCIFYSFNAFEGTWEQQSKSERREENEGKYQAYISSIWDTTRQVWIPNFRETTLREEDLEHITYFRWNEDLSTWELGRNSLTKYYNDKKIRVHENKTYYFDGMTWQGKRDSSLYDDQGWLLERTEANIGQESQVWEFYERRTYTYFPDGKKETESIYQWKEEQQSWELWVTYSYTYNDEGSILSRILEYRRPYAQESETYTYDDEGKEILWVKAFRRYDPGPLIFREKREKSYNEQGFLVQSERFEWSEELSLWQPLDIVETSYDSLGKKLQEEEKKWNADSMKYLFEEKQIFSYHPDNSIKDKILFRVSFSGPDLWGTRTSWAYTPQRPGSERIHYRWDPSTESWIPERKSENKFTDSGQALYYSSFSWDEEKQKWIGLSKIGFNYDAQGRRIRFYRSIWIEFNNRWFTKTSTRFYFGPCEAERILASPREELLIYPNPLTHDRLFIESQGEGPYSYQIFSLDGKEILSGELMDAYSSLALPQLINGTYLIKVTAGNKESLRKLQISR